MNSERFYSQKIAEQKLQAFAIGAMGQRPLSRREQEERRKREEEQAAASVNKIAPNNIPAQLNPLALHS